MRSLRPAFAPALFAFVALVAVACGGADASDLFGSSGSSSTSTSSSSTSSTSSTSSSGGSDASTSSSGGNDASASSSGSKDAAVDAPVVVLTDKDHVFCGKANGNDVFCPTGSICCARGKVQGGQLDYNTFECLANKNQCNGNFDATLECDDKNDCKQGEFCCAQTMPTGAGNRYVRTFCQQNNCQGTSARMCQTGANDECPNGSQCSQSQVLKDFGVCSQ